MYGKNFLTEYFFPTYYKYAVVFKTRMVHYLLLKVQ